MSGLHASGKIVRDYIASGGGTSEAPSYRKKVFGYNGSLMMAGRAPGYKSAPHIHRLRTIQLSGQRGALHLVEKRAFFLKEGDFLRVPANTVHWAWGEEGKEKSVLFEFHSPALIKGSVASADTLALFDDGEPPEPRGSMDNLYVDPEVYPPDEAENGLVSFSPLFRSAQR